MKKVLTIGGATQDIFICCSEQEIEEFCANTEISKVSVETIHYASGGGATNAAVSFKRQGFDVAAFFKIGHDSPGEFIIRQLQQAHIDISLATYSNTARTGISFIVPMSKECQRVFAYRGANAHLQAAEIPLETIIHYDVWYITSLSENSAYILPELVRKGREKNIFIAHNPGTSQLKNPEKAQELLEILSYIDVLILNHYEASLLFKTVQNTIIQAPFKEYFSLVLDKGVKIAVVTAGADGVYAATAREHIFQKSMATKIVNTVGAGDAFGSAFVANILRNDSLKTSTFAGCVNSASVLAHYDAKQGLLTDQELKKRLEKFF